MNTITRFASSLRRRLFTRTGGLAFACAVAVSAGASAIAAHEPGDWHHGGAMTQAAMDAHVDQMLDVLFATIGASDAQKVQIAPLVKEAFADLMPLHETLKPAHDELVALLAADPVDRAAIENVRVEHMRAAETASQRIARLIGDVADLLTPAQRRALATHIANHPLEMHG